MARRKTALVGLLATFVGAFGCADPEGEFGDFAERYQLIDRPTVGPIDCMAVPAAGEADGDFFMALLLPSVNETIPLTLLASLTTTAAEDGELAMTLSLQALDASDRKTPVGEPWQHQGTVAKDGKFEVMSQTFTLVESANPFSSSLAGDYPAELQSLSGSLCAPAESLCGNAAPQILDPRLPFPGATFTMQRVEQPEDYPEPPTINCAGDLADEL